jgi:hypothetical protein
MTADIKDSNLLWLHSVWDRVWGKPARTEGGTVNAETLPVLMSQSRRGDFNAHIFFSGVNNYIAIMPKLSASATVINHNWISGFLYHSPIHLSEHDPFFFVLCSSLFIVVRSLSLAGFIPSFSFCCRCAPKLTEIIPVTYQSKALTTVLKFLQDLPQSQPAPAKTRL